MTNQRDIKEALSAAEQDAEAAEKRQRGGHPTPAALERPQKCPVNVRPTGHTPGMASELVGYTRDEAADACGMTYEAMRARVDRGSLRAGKRREDGTRVIPKSELERLGLLPGADIAELQAEIDRLQEELKTHRLLTERAEGQTAAERKARELIEQTMHQERSEKQSLALQLHELEQAHEDATIKLTELRGAGFFARRRLLRELRAQAGA